MTDERIPLAALLTKAADHDVLRCVTEAVLQLRMEADAEGMIGTGRHDRTSYDQTTGTASPAAAETLLPAVSGAAQDLGDHPGRRHLPCEVGITLSQIFLNEAPRRLSCYI